MTPLEETITVACNKATTQLRKLDSNLTALAARLIVMRRVKDIAEAWRKSPNQNALKL